MDEYSLNTESVGTDYEAWAWFTNLWVYADRKTDMVYKSKRTDWIFQGTFNFALSEIAIESICT